MKSFLLEIGSEEIPARFVQRGMDMLKTEISKLLTESFIEYGEVQGFATPRRLAVHIENVVERQKDRIVESIGPPKKISYDTDGKPTKAAIGFAKSLHIDVTLLKTVETDRGEYLSATVEEKGRPTASVLSDAIPRLVSSLQLPKSMRWGSGELRFFRPIHWIVALYGNDIVSFELDGIKSSNITFGHRFLSPGPIVLEKADDYTSSLTAAQVIADMEERKTAIANQMSNIESSHDCTVFKDEELLNTVTNLVEFPTAVLGSFEEKYLDLPSELPVTVMRTHQKYFSTQNKDGDLLPHFIIISNTMPENNDTVRRGAEKVLRARLEDARFYFSEDQTKVFSDYVEDLKRVTFQEKLGSMFDKSDRVVNLCSYLADSLHVNNKDDILRAARLSKADLVTGVVSEFPELQGYMGMIYATRSGENARVAQAIEEHYKPKFAGDSLPSGEAGTLISLADRIDNIASFFFLGLIPTGSEDPFALRRQAAGLIHIILSRGYSIAIHELLGQALNKLEPSRDKRAQIISDIIQFFNQRLEGILLAQGYSHDLIHAVLSTERLDIKSLSTKIETLASLKKDKAFPGLLIAAKRVYNILAKTEPLELDPVLLSENSEKELLKASESVSNELVSNGYKALYALESPINTFFDKVLVMDKDPRIRDNRLALLQRVKAIFDSLGNFSEILED